MTALQAQPSSSGLQPIERARSRGSSIGASAGRSSTSSNSGGGSSSAGFASGHSYTPASVVPPSGSILNNAHEAPKRPSASNGKNKEGVTAALKGMFKHPPQAGKQMKVAPGAPPLGKTFERTAPVTAQTIKGPEVLEVDPRGEDASVGDGIVLSPTSAAAPKPPPSDAGDAASEAGASASGDADRLGVNGNGGPHSGSTSSEYADSSAGGDGSMLSSSPSAASSSAWGDGEIAAGRRESAVSAVSDAQSSAADSLLNSGSGSGRSRQSSVASGSIRFCPLPVSGRLKRANSITIGVAARSHLLQSQGSARQNYNVQPNSPALYGSMQQQQQQQQGGWAPRAPSQGWPQGRPTRQEDIVDVGELMQKGAMKAWRKVRGRSASRDSSSASARSSSVASSAGGDAPAPSARASASPSAAAAAPDGQSGKAHVRDASEPLAAHAEEDEHDVHGRRTPRRAASPQPLTQAHRSSAEADRVRHLQHAHAHDASAGGDGTRTPRAGGGAGAGANPGDALAHDNAFPHLERRLSTGAFLKDASLRQIQETRRRELLGDDDGDSASSGSDRDGGTRTPGEPRHHHHHHHHVETPLGTEHEDHKEQKGWISGFIPRSIGLPAFLAGEQPVAPPVRRSADQPRTAAGEDEDVFVEASDGGADSGEARNSENADAEDEDDEETREAERLADLALSSHSDKAMRAGGIERIDRRKS